MYLSFEHMRGNLDKLQLQKELSIVKEAIKSEKKTSPRRIFIFLERIIKQ